MFFSSCLHGFPLGTLVSSHAKLAIVVDVSGIGCIYVMTWQPVPDVPHHCPLGLSPDPQQPCKG